MPLARPKPALAIRVSTGMAAPYRAGRVPSTMRGTVARVVVLRCLSSGSMSESGVAGPTFSKGRQKLFSGRVKGDPASAAPGSSGGAAGSGPSPVSSPVSPSMSGVASGCGVDTAAAASMAVSTAPYGDSEADYEAPPPAAGNNIVAFATRQPRALVLDCAYRPINVLNWFRAFHFQYFGKGEVLEFYPPPAVCTTGAGDHPLPAVLRVPQYTADMQDLCARVACTKRNVMVRDGFCCQYCGSHRDLTIDHLHPTSRGGDESWDNLVTACMRCNQRKRDRTLRELGWKLKRAPKEPTPYEIGIVAGIATSDILRPPPEWELYISPYRERLEKFRVAAVEAGLVNLMESDS